MLTVLLACAGSDPVAEPSAELPPAYDVSDYTDVERPTASFDQDRVEEALQVAIDEVLWTAATPVLDGYAAGMAYAEADCPTLYDVDGNTVWYDYCTTSAGATFSGYGFYYLYENADAFGDGVLYDGAVVSGLGEIISPDGDAVVVGGTAGLLEGSTETYDVYISLVQGSFSWDGDGAEHTWLDEGLQPSLQVYAVVAPDYDAHVLTVTGGLDGLTDASGQRLDLATVSLNDISIADEVVGSPCDQEPGGSIALRDGSGTWFSIAFDIDEDNVLTGRCDGCGEVTLNGEVVGEACADFSPWLDWGDRPW